jgi:Protein kinase domain
MSMYKAANAALACLCFVSLPFLCFLLSSLPAVLLPPLVSSDVFHSSPFRFRKSIFVLIYKMSNAPQPEVLGVTEVFTETDGDWGYDYTAVLYRVGAAFYRGQSRERCEKENVHLEDIYESTPIPLAQLYPIFPQHFTRAPEPLPPNSHVKKPRLISYDPSHPTELPDGIFHEATIWETLVQSPHPNIIKYYGCQVEDGRITGLCFAKQHDSLMSRVNPGCHGKRLFPSHERPLKDIKAFLEGIEKGLKHIHVLGLVHNDINPANIMFATKDDEIPIIIDFDTCWPIGHSMQGVPRTPEWHDENALISLPQNDLDALHEIAEWLSQKENKNWKFELMC